ncbi:MAG: hypothetical protein GXP19_06330 [Gammaproteobacteria bacterium]|nr:hypothetical protein [Gammaproteobacteria bacterium]
MFLAFSIFCIIRLNGKHRTRLDPRTREIDACGLNGKVASGFFISSLFEDWHSTITKVFSVRHKVAHDANYRPEIDVPFIQQAEALFLIKARDQVLFLAFSIVRQITRLDPWYSYSEYDECIERTNESYDNYKQKREEVIKGK